MDVNRAQKFPFKASAGSFGWFHFFCIALSIFLCFLILYPLFHVFWSTFVEDFQHSFLTIKRVISDFNTAEILFNTVFCVLCSTVFALLVGSLFAWLSERTDIGMERVTKILPISPLLVPPIAGAIGWVLLGSPNSGFLNGFFRSFLRIFGLSHSTGPINIFTWGGLIFVYTLYLVPEVYLTISASLRSLDPGLEEASRMSGAGPFSTLFRVTLPSVKHAITSAAALALLTGFALFSVPVIIGPQAGIEVLSVQIVKLMTAEFPPRIAVALILGIIVMFFIGAAWIVQARVLRAKRFATIGGRGVRVAKVRLGIWRVPCRAFIVAYLLFTSALPLFALIVVSLQPFWSTTINVELFTLKAYVAIFSTDFSRQALLNSLLLGVFGGALGMMIGALVCYTVTTMKQRRLANFIDAVTKLPGSVSHLVIAIAFIAAFAGPPFGLQGTTLILLLAYLVLYIPQATLTASSSLAQIGRELGESSLMSGAGQGRTFLRITLPLMTSGLVSGWTLLFVLMAGDVTASAMLAGTTNPVVGFVLLDLWENGSYAGLAAYGALISVIMSAVMMTVLILTRRWRWVISPST